MKKIFLLLACFICLKASAQIAAVNDTTRITASPTFSPQFIPNIFNSGGVNYRVTYVYNPSTQKYDAVIYSKYLRRFYLAKNDSALFVTPYYFNHHQGIVQKAYIDSLNAAIFSQSHNYTAKQFFNFGIDINGTNLDMAGGVILNTGQIYIRDSNGATYQITKFPGTMQMGTTKYGFVLDSASNRIYSSGSGGIGPGIPYALVGDTTGLSGVFIKNTAIYQTGAVYNVARGINSGIAGNGYQEFLSQSLSPASTSGRLRLYSDSLNRLSWKNSNYRRTIRSTRSRDETFTMPYRNDPIIADSTDIVTAYLPKASPTYTSTLNGSRQNVGDTTRNSLIYALGTSITRGVGSSNVTQYDSTYLSKLGRAMGFRWTNRGLSGRFLEQPGAADSSGYSQRYSIPAPTSVKDIYEIELQVNDAYHDSTIYTPANYQIQLDSMVVAAHTKGWAYNRIWIHNTGYYNPVSSNPTAPNTVYRHSLFLAKDIAVATARGTLQSDNYAAMQTAVGIDPSLYDSNLLHPTNKGHTMIHVLDSTYLASVGITKVNFATNIQNVIGSQYIFGDVNGQQNLNARNDANISNNANITNDAIIGRNITIAGTGSIGTTLAVGTIATVTTRVSTPSVQNITTGNNSTVNLTDNGVVLLRNIADATAAVTSQNSNASSTGSIHVFKFGSTTKATISKDGYIGIGTTAPTAKIQLFGTATLNPWGSTLAQNLLISANTITDNTTADASTITTANINYFGIPTINAANSSTGITYTTANNVVIAGAPTITGTNAVATNAYALNVLAGGTRLGALTASQAVFTDANKQLVSNAITGSGSVVMSTSPTLTTPNLGTPSTLIATNATGTASGLTAGNVTTNANLTGPITSVGNATTVTAASITNAMLAGSIDLTAKVTGILPIANGGTNSATQNFVDISTNQSSIAGIKGWAPSTTGTTAATTYTIANAASGNNQMETGMQINASYSDGAFTGAMHNPFRISWGTSNFGITDIPGAGSTAMYSISSTYTSNNYFLRADGSSVWFNAPSSSGTVFFRIGNSTAAVILPTTGNVGIGVLGTATTDNGTDKLQVSGGTISSGLAGTTLGGYKLSGNTSGTIAILPQAAAGSYNFNLPITVGTAGQVLTSQAGGSTAMTWSNVPLNQASANLTAQTAAGNITTFTVGAATATFNVSAYVNVTAVATDVIQAQVTYTDENNTSQTVSFTTLNTVTNSTYSPVTIRAKNATVITLKTNLTVGAGSITFDAGGSIIQN